MSTNNRIGRVVLAALLTLGAAALGARAAEASAPVAGQVTGTVSAVTASSITVNGTTYQLLAKSPALEQVSAVQPGEIVTLVLNGPANSASSRVVAIPPPVATKP
jgi:hypothetical protein